MVGVIPDERTQLISNWYKSSKLDYLSAFMKLWVAFNSWYNLNMPEETTEQPKIKKLKEHLILQDNFKKKLSADSDEGKELRKAVSILIEETEDSPMVDVKGKIYKFAKSNVTKKIKSEYENRKEVFEKDAENIGKTFKFEDFIDGEKTIPLDEYNTIVIDDTNVVYGELIDIIYQIRCSIFHGSIDTEPIRTERLVKSAYACLSIIFRSEVMAV